MVKQLKIKTVFHVVLMRV